MAQRKAATAIEDLIDRKLTEAGKPELVKQWRDARRDIARTYDAEAAFNDVSGNFSARQLAKMYERDSPLSGGMRQVAKTARAFEGSMRDVDKMRDVTELSFADGLLGTIGGTLGGSGAGLAGGLPGAGLVFARPAIRRGLLAKPMQRGPMTMILDDLKKYGLATGRFGGQMAGPLALTPALGLRVPEAD